MFYVTKNNHRSINPLSTNLKKRSNTLKHICLSVFDHFVGLALKSLRIDVYLGSVKHLRRVLLFIKDLA